MHASNLKKLEVRSRNSEVGTQKWPSSAIVFNTVADLFEWILIHPWSVEDLLHYLDDYFTLGAAGTNICANRLAAIDQAAQLTCGHSTCP